MNKKESICFDGIRALLNEEGFCFVCKKSILDHTRYDMLKCIDGVKP